MATQPVYPLLTAGEFLQIDFGDRKAELDNGVIRMMAGAAARHNRVQFNIMLTLGQKLRGTGCTPYGPDMAVCTHDSSIRYPDVVVLCGKDEDDNDDKLAFDDPRIMFEILLKRTSRTDLKVKLPEYQTLESVDTIVFVDIAAERVRIVQRTEDRGWKDNPHKEPVEVPLPAFGFTLTHDEIFARD